jgi:multidrug transporter EmrE-like cation transporter
MVASGICVAANHKFNLALSGEIPSAVFFPIVNGGNLVLTTLSALIIFKEKLTKRQWIGVTLGILSVLALCMPTELIFSFELSDLFNGTWSYKEFINSLN